MGAAHRLPITGSPAQAQLLKYISGKCFHWSIYYALESGLAGQYKLKQAEQGGFPLSATCL